MTIVSLDKIFYFFSAGYSEIVYYCLVRTQVSIHGAFWPPVEFIGSINQFDPDCTEDAIIIVKLKLSTLLKRRMQWQVINGRYSFHPYGKCKSYCWINWFLNLDLWQLNGWPKYGSLNMMNTSSLDQKAEKIITFYLEKVE